MQRATVIPVALVPEVERVTCKAERCKRNIYAHANVKPSTVLPVASTSQQKACLFELSHCVLRHVVKAP